MTMGRNEYDRANMGTHNYVDRLVAGAEVFGADDEKIGTVADVGQNYFLVQKGWLFIKDVYLPTSVITQADANTVYVSLTKQEAEQMGRDVLPGNGDAWYDTQRTGYATDYTTDREVSRTVTEGENMRMPIVEEQLKAGVRETDAGRARIIKDVRQEQQTIDVPVTHEEVYVSERTVNRPATAADLTMRERAIEIPLKEQEVVTQKQAIVTGEVNVRKETMTDTERVTDTVRREDVRIEDAGSDRVHVENERGMTNRTGDRTTGTTDTAYDRTGMAGDRYEATRRDEENKFRNR